MGFRVNASVAREGLQSDIGLQLAGWRTVARDVGGIQMLVAAGMLVALAVALAYREFHTALALAASAAAAAGLGALADRSCRGAPEPKRRHALVIAGAGWLAAAAFGALPFFFAAWWTPAEVARAFVPAGENYASSLVYFRDPLHALFESMSAYTTTGLTMAVHEPSIGRGLLFYRSLAQWIGGAGVIVLSLAVIPRPRAVGELELYQSEATGTKLRPRVLQTARAIWKTYAALTLVVTGYLYLALRWLLPDYGVAASLFDAVNHAMTAQSTGGFSTLDDSISGYGSYALELVHIPPMWLGAISLPLYYSVLHARDLRLLARDPQFRAMLALFAGLTPVLALALAGDTAVADALRESLFQVVSAVSTTGWQTSAIGGWSDSAVLLLAWGAMLVGGSAGATVGGLKLIRAVLILKASTWRLRAALLPVDAVVPFRVGARTLSTAELQREVAEAGVFTALYLLLLAGSTVVVAQFAGPGFTLADVIFECLSAQSTVGLSSGLTDPAMSPVVEWVFVVQMWAGRLEILPVLVLLRALAGGIWRR